MEPACCLGKGKIGILSFPFLSFIFGISYSPLHLLDCRVSNKQSCVVGTIDSIHRVGCTALASAVPSSAMEPRNKASKRPPASRFHQQNMCTRSRRPLDAAVLLGMRCLALSCV